MTRAPLLGPIVVAMLLAAPATARAAGDDVATAQVLFDEGRRRMAQHDFAGACPKLEESQRLSAAVGTEFNLADCWEHVGKLASAWAAFLDVADQTHRRGEAERERAARERAGALEPRLARVTIEVAAARRIAGLEVQRDGQPVRDALWGVGVPVDAGDHRVEAHAPGRRAWASVVRATDGQTSSISVPELPEGPTAVATVATADRRPEVVTVPAPPHVAPASPPGPDRTAAFVVLGGSVALAGLGVVGLLEHDQSVSNYNADGTCPPIGASSRPAHCDSLVNAANTWMTVAVVGFVTSGLALAGGITLWVTAPHPAASAQIWCAPGVGSVGCMGRF